MRTICLIIATIIQLCEGPTIACKIELILLKNKYSDDKQNAQTGNWKSKVNKPNENFPVNADSSK
jgi:hypothetical protein